MNVTLSPEQQSALDDLAASTGRDVSTLVADAVDDLLHRQHNLAILREELQVGIDELERGEGILLTEETMQEFFDDICREGRAEFERKKLSS